MKTFVRNHFIVTIHCKMLNQITDHLDVNMNFGSSQNSFWAVIHPCKIKTSQIVGNMLKALLDYIYSCV